MYKKFISAISLVLLFSLMAAGISAQGLDYPTSEALDLPKHVPGEILIRFQPWLNSKQVSIRLEELDLIPLREIPRLGVRLVKIPAGQTVEQAVTRYSHQPGVAYAEPNYILEIAKLQQTETTGLWGFEKIQAEQAWLELSESERNEILLATVDTGIDPDHSDLNANIWNNSDEISGNGIDDDDNGYVDDTWGWDFVNSDNVPFDDNMHGTAVSSVMVGVQETPDNVGVVGVCPWCKVMAVKVMTANGTGTLDVVASGIVYATDNDARVINLSLAGVVGSQTLEDAVDYAWNEGALVVAAAGNDGLNTTRYPAAYTNAIAVGSTGPSDYHSCFSNYAEGYISVVAPGEAILVATPNQGYGTYSGTSLSTPHVAGLGGLLFSQLPGRTNIDVKTLIEFTSEDLGSPDVDMVFGYGRINAYRAVTNDQTQTTPPDGLFSTSDTATGYAHARKIVRDTDNVLHMIWHTKVGTRYRIRYATSSDNGLNWDLQQDDVFSSDWESYHPALATDGEYLFAAIPSKTGPEADAYYQILFTRKLLPDGGWEDAVPIMGGETYHTVRPDMYFDPTNERLHVIASSLDHVPEGTSDLYYRASEDQGINWGELRIFNPSDSTSKTRYATLHANGDKIYVVARTVTNYLNIITYYFMYTTYSTDGGATWNDKTQISSFLAFTAGEYGISLAGFGDRVYMGYEVGGNLYFRRYDGAGWSDYLQLEASGEKWPSITQAQDGQAWLLFEGEGGIFMRHYDGTTWEAKEFIGPGNYPNLKLGTQGDQIEWVYTNCNGAPFTVEYDARPVYGGPIPTDTPTPTPTDTPTPTPTDTPTPPPTDTPTPTPTDTPTPTPTDTPTPSPTPVPTLPVQVLDQVASGQTAVSGTVSGSYLDTHADDDQTQTITEAHSGGKPTNRISYMEHKWSFEVHPGETLTFFTNAWALPSNDGDTFKFYYSTDDEEYTEMFTISAISDTGNYQSYNLPYSIAGRVYVRLVDTDRTGGNRDLDTVYIDHLFVRSETAAGYLPAKPSNLVASPASSTQINLTWTDNASDAIGFQIERTGDGYPWQTIATVLSDVTSFNDTSLQPSTTYSYRVRAYNATGYSDYSDIASATTIQASYMHVSDIDGDSIAAPKNRWNALVDVYIHDQSDSAVQGATIFGTWSNGSSGTCTTDSSGSCQISLSNLKSNVASVTFTITDVTAVGWEYHPSDNHDIDGDSDGSEITVNKP